MKIYMYIYIYIYNFIYFIACFKCKEEGHMSRECPTNTGDEKPRG